MGIVFIPVLSIFMSSSLAIQLAGEETKAVGLAQEGMEILKGKGYTRLRNELQGQGQGEICWQDAAGDAEDYRREMKLKCLPLEDFFPGAEGEIIFLEVSVFWGKGGQVRSVSLVSLLGEGAEILGGGL